MWPFGGKTLPAETVQHVRQSCGMQIQGLGNCLKANKDHPEVCNALAAQVDMCRARFVAPEIAAKYQGCVSGSFNRNNHKFENLEACEPRLKELRRALRKYSNVP